MTVASRGSTKNSGPDESKETEAKVDDYAPRPYSEAITDEHREALKEAGISVDDAASVSETTEA